MATESDNILFQSEQHPLVALDFESEESYVISLVHRKAYRARRLDGLSSESAGFGLQQWVWNPRDL